MMTGQWFKDPENIKAVFDAFPVSILIIDKDYVIHDMNQSAMTFLNFTSLDKLPKLCGDVLRCANAHTEAGGCGDSKFCPDCVIRQSIHDIENNLPAFRRASRMCLRIRNGFRDVWMMISGSAVKYNGSEMFFIVLEDISEVMELRKLLPICSHCHKIRDDSDYWHNVEDYLNKNTALRFTHGLCPDCLLKHYPEYTSEPASRE